MIKSIGYLILSVLIIFFKPITRGLVYLSPAFALWYLRKLESLNSKIEKHSEKVEKNEKNN